MNKQDLIEVVAERTGLTKKMVSDVLDAAIGAITGALRNNQNVTVTGFGTFRVSLRKARSGVSPRNPKERIQIPALKVPAFKAGKTLKDAIR
jgi:DNA-binding protein HU-beta